MQLQMCLTLLSAVLAAACAFQWWTSNRNRKAGARSLPPAASGIPLIGDTFSTIALGPVVIGRRRHGQLGKIYRAWFLGEQVIHIGDAESVKRLMNAEHDLVEENWPYTIKALIGRKSVTNAVGAYHTQIRKILLPAFTPKASQQYIPRMVEVAEELCAEWAAAKHVKGEDTMKAYTFQVATELIVGFGRSYVTKELLAHQQMLWNTWLEGFLSLPINLPGFAFYKAMQARKTLLEEYESNIRGLLEKADDAADRSDSSDFKTSMQMVIEAADKDDTGKLDMEFLKDTAVNLLFAGHDTSASALMLILRQFKLRSATLQRLRDEQQQVVKDYGSSIDSESLRMMPYTDAAMKEILRLCVIATVAPRTALKTFEVGGYAIPKGHKLQLELWKVIEEDRRWMGLTGDFAPEVFNPDSFPELQQLLFWAEKVLNDNYLHAMTTPRFALGMKSCSQLSHCSTLRWLTEEGQRVGAHLPFGAGARMCLGYNFALLEIKVLLAVLARGYDWQVDLNEPVKTFPLPVPAHGLPMTFQKL